MQEKQAETVAIQALEWLADDPDLIGAFLGASGISVNELGNIGAEPAFLAAVLDFVLMADSHVTGFCDRAGLPYDTPMRARAALPGGAVVHWT